MPYTLQKKRGYDLYWVINKITKHKFSKEALPLTQAQAQMRALYANTRDETKEEELHVSGGATHRENVLRRYGLKEGQSLPELSKVTGVALSVLRKVYDRGIGAYKTNPISVRMKGSFKKGVKAPMSMKLSKEQWAMARVYSFLDNNPKHDNDLRETKGGGLGEEEDLVGGRLHLRDNCLFWCK